MSDPELHIAAWEAAGLIDAATAARLRAAPDAAAALASAGPTQVDHPAASSARPASGASALFGPGVSIGEMFGYIGGAFLLGAWTAFLARMGESTGDPRIAIGLGSFVAAIVVAGLGAWLRRGPDRFRRGAGVAFVVATGAIGAGVLELLRSAGVDAREDVALVLAAGAALVGAVAFRAYLPAVLTHLGVLAAGTVLASTILSWVNASLQPLPAFDEVGNYVAPATGGVDPLLLTVGQAACWVALAVVIGLVGLREARNATPAAGRRAAASRAWAGFVVVLGITQAVTMSRQDSDFSHYRVIEPWLGALIILIVCAVLVERAFHREASAYVYPAALGFLIAATDLNVTYLSRTIEIALLVEGGVLLGAGVVADRLRRRIGARPVSAGPAPAAA